MKPNEYIGCAGLILLIVGVGLVIFADDNMLRIRGTGLAFFGAFTQWTFISWWGLTTFNDWFSNK